jgi:hypothetical protein
MTGGKANLGDRPTIAKGIMYFDLCHKVVNLLPSLVKVGVIYLRPHLPGLEIRRCHIQRCFTASILQKMRRGAEPFLLCTYREGEVLLLLQAWTAPLLTLLVLCKKQTIP